MNTTGTSTNAAKTTYKIVSALLDDGFEVMITTPNRTEWLHRLNGDVRKFATRNGARKAISRAIRGISR